MTKVDRRHFLKTTAGAAAIPALAMLPGVSHAAGGQVIVGTWGGDYQVLLQNSVSPLMGKEGIEVNYDVANSTQRITKLRAERNSRRGSMDVALLGEIDMYEVYSAGSLANVVAASVPNLVNVHDQFKTPYSVPHIFSAMTIVYNKEKFSTPPDSLEVFNDPKYKGKVGFSDILYQYSALFLAGISGSKKADDFEPGKKLLMDIKKNSPRVYPSNEAVSTAFKSGEIWLSCMWKARALQWQDAGLPVALSIPKEGAIPVVFEAAVAKNSRNPENAWKFLNALLDPDVQVASARIMGYAPTVKNVQLPPGLQAKVGFSADEMARMRPYDLKLLMENKAAILDFWNREFKAGL